MITFMRDDKKFTYRVAGVAIDKNRVLLQQVEGFYFWFLPGGRGELLESSTETLFREMQEEMGVEVRVDRLLWLMENLYSNRGMFYHELGLYYLMTFPEDSPILSQDEIFREDEGFKFCFKWHHLDRLDGLDMRPSFFKTALKHIPDTIEHIIHSELGSGE